MKVLQANNKEKFSIFSSWNKKKGLRFSGETKKYIRLFIVETEKT